MTGARISDVDVIDVRFPTSREPTGSDAMNPDPDYSAAYVLLRTDAGDGPAGHAFAFTIGRGNDVQAAAIAALRDHVVGLPVEAVRADPGSVSRALVGDSRLRRLGPEKGVAHMATGAVVNAVGDLAARRAGKPVWKLLADADPKWPADQVDFRYIEDALTREEAVALLHKGKDGAAGREARLLADGYPAYTTSPGWPGPCDDKLVRLAVDANQRWNVSEAVAWTAAPAAYDPYWIEEPTSPDDILGHAAVRRGVVPVKVATGEHAHNRVDFKQVLQADAIDVLQVDAARVGGVNENLAILLLAAKYGVPVRPHAGGVGLCELVRHLSMFDFVALTATTEDRVIEYVDGLQEHFEDPAVVVGGRHVAPTAPGFSSRMRAASIAAYRYPDGSFWAADAAGPAVRQEGTHR
jgi:L-fuconate dehydratase